MQGKAPGFRLRFSARLIRAEPILKLSVCNETRAKNLTRWSTAIKAMWARRAKVQSHSRGDVLQR